jgi:hypothetical protein
MFVVLSIIMGAPPEKQLLRPTVVDYIGLLLVACALAPESRAGNNSNIPAPRVFYQGEEALPDPE